MSYKTGEFSVTEVFTCKAIVAVVSTSLYILYFQIEIISAQIAIGFNIPVHNTSIYLDKLVCFRSLMFVIGLASEYIFFRVLLAISGGDQNSLRIKINLGSFVLLLTLRIMLFLVTCFSSNIAYHVYFALGFESFGIGATGSSIFAIVPEHVAVLVLFAHLSRFLTSLVQFCLDLIFGQNSLAKIRCQFLFCTILNFIAIICFYYYHNKLKCSLLKLEEKPNNEGSSGGGTNKKPIIGYFETFGYAASPFFMFATGSLLFDVLFPGILPFGFLPREKCHLINMVLPIANVSGPVFLFCLETARMFHQWGQQFDAAWILATPMVIIFVYAFLAIHTRIPSAKAIRNSRTRVLTITFISAFCYSFLDTLSFAGVTKVVFLSECFMGDVGVIMAHQFFCQAIRFLFLKSSVGYNVTRIGLGYHFPKFRPNHRMSKSNTFWYIFKNTFKRAGKDTVNDFKMNIKNYL